MRGAGVIAIASSGDGARWPRSSPPLVGWLAVLAERVGDHKTADLATLELTFGDFRPQSFPLPAETGKAITPADFPAILADIRREAAEALGAGFDRLP